ncbi:MAG: hypothetical protein SO015_00850 [Wujia sp.]|nr:hypothetical protein [Wujia sp.]MBO4952332.1 hypothetical protein [Lachnospiraceae bacterium]MCI6239993.1 hypothetical protein [Clostridium sp.]MDD7283659.1 hypothetical protein [Clostridium sp.]MDY3726679.1 hypothetical protein [Wujia sp.]
MEGLTRERALELQRWGRAEEARLDKEHEEALAYARKRIKILDAKCNFTAEEQRLLDEITEEMLSEEK